MLFNNVPILYDIVKDEVIVQHYSGAYRISLPTEKIDYFILRDRHSPNIKTDTHGNTRIIFYTSDKKGKYNVVLQGMTANGKFGEQSFTFEVK